jgi:hypothetical protein
MRYFSIDFFLQKLSPFEIYILYLFHTYTFKGFLQKMAFRLFALPFVLMIIIRIEYRNRFIIK